MVTKNSPIEAELVPAPVAKDAPVPTLDPMPNAQIFAELENPANKLPAFKKRPDTSHYPAYDAVQYEFEDFGAMIDPDAEYNDFGITCKGTIRFGDRLFPLNAEDREKIYDRRRVNMASGPRIAALQPMGEFLPKDRAFRGVKYRTINGLQRVQW